MTDTTTHESQSSISLSNASLDLGTWDLPRRRATIREIVEALDPLLEAVRLQLGPGANRDALLDQLHGTLGFASREASLPLAHIAADDILRRDLAARARSISDYLVRTVREVNEAGISIERHGEPWFHRLLFRSRCDGHLWRPDVTTQLTGPHGGPHVMQLYNEWLHQIVLLRDSLIPFANWESLPVPLDRLSGARGLRALEPARGRFVGDLLTKQVENVTILRMAQAVFGIEDEDNSYGFSAGGITVLPSSVGADIEMSNKALLSWRDAAIPGLPTSEPVRFRYATDDYFALPRSEIGAGTASPKSVAATARLDARRIGDSNALVDIVVAIGNETFRIDLGQALRGHRFSYRATTEERTIRPAADGQGAAAFHDLAELFSLPALATAGQGTHVIQRSADPLVDLAVLGKIYPENTIIRGNASWEAVHRSGKQYGSRFVLQDHLASGGAV